MDHGKQFFLSPFLLYEIADAPGLEVRDDYLRRIFGVNEATIKLGHRQQLLVANCNQYVRRETVGPLGGVITFFLYRHAFCEPAWHTMVGCREHIDVAHLVPQSSSPVEITG